jgi:hypothetical protein
MGAPATLKFGEWRDTADDTSKAKLNEGNRNESK